MSGYDLAVLGAGPGGYVAAIRAARNGLRTVVVEQGTPGGVCLNWGCIPTKALIAAASLIRDASRLEEFGIRMDRGGFDYGAVQRRSRRAAEKLSKGVRYLLKKNGVELVAGRGELAADLSLRVDDGRRLEARNILIATGSRSRAVPGFAFDEEDILSSRGLLDCAELPASILILGGGAIGVEFAYLLNALGVEVTLVELLDSILPGEDPDAVRVVAESLVSQGITLKTRTRALDCRRRRGLLAVRLEKEGRTEILEAEKILVAVGRVPNSAGLGLNEAGVRLHGEAIACGPFYRTSAERVYAVGDVKGPPMLAHAASQEGLLVADHLAGKPTPERVRDELVPRAVYCEPELAAFGLTEKQARERGLTVETSLFPFRGAGKTVAVGRPEGLVKIIAERKTGEILGAHLAGLHSTEIVHELLLAKTGELLAEDIARTIHAHPTVSEAVREAAEGFCGGPIHI